MLAREYAVVVKRVKPLIVLEPVHGEREMRYVIRYGRNWQRMRPEQQAAVLRAAADYLEGEVQGMRERADALTDGGL